jgi:DNA-binding transcriptional ArsR family regulator
MDDTHLLTPSSLKALAHPIRVKLLGLLRADGPSTATALATRLGESSGTTSYHLRQLAGAGFVVEDTGRGNARDRWWRAAQQVTRLDTSGWPDDPDVQPAVETYLGAVLEASVRKALAAYAERSSWTRAWRDNATLSDLRLNLTPAELGRLNVEVEAVVERYRRDPRKGDQPVIVQWQSFPDRSPS